MDLLEKAGLKEVATVDHGGSLGRARALFPPAPQPFVDLSTGINPHSYLLFNVPATAGCRNRRGPRWRSTRPSWTSNRRERALPECGWWAHLQACKANAMVGLKGTHR